MEINHLLQYYTLQNRLHFQSELVPSSVLFSSLCISLLLAVTLAPDLENQLEHAHEPTQAAGVLQVARTRYCKSLEPVMTGSGIVQKLDSLDDGLRYMRAEGMHGGEPCNGRDGFWISMTHEL